MAHAMEVEVNEERPGGWTRIQVLAALVNDDSPFDVDTERSQYGADIVVAVLEDMDACGKSADIYAQFGSEAFATVELWCATSTYAFAHEVGHLLGGIHTITNQEDWCDEVGAPECPYHDGDDAGDDYDEDDWPTTYAGTATDAHGKQKPGEGTLMSIAVTRLPYLSNETLKFPGTQISMGSVYYENNFRVFRVHAPTLEGHEDAIVEEENPPDVLESVIAGATELEWKETTTLDSDPIYNPADEVCNDCLVHWYERWDAEDDWSYTGVNTTTYYLSMVWTEGHEFHVEVTDGIQSSEDDHFIEYCSSGCGGPKRGQISNDQGDVANPQVFELHEAYPNPFNPSTRISFSLPYASHAVLTVHDVLGRRVATLLDEMTDAGLQDRKWYAGNIPSGVYFIRLVADGESQLQTVILSK